MDGEQSGELPPRTSIAVANLRASKVAAQTEPGSCPCCGAGFDDGPHRIHGPYSAGPYVYVCEDCWSRSYLFFPDKEIREDGLTRVPRSASLEKHGQATEFAVLGSTIRFSITPQSVLEGEVVGVGLSALKLDPSNVRFHDRKEPLDDEEIERAIWSEPATKSLMREILASRGLSEMPIVDSRMTVREGNRRVVCLRRLLKLATEGKLGDVSSDAFSRVRCIVLKPQAADKDIAIYLARVHVGGKRQWLAVNKAAHVFELHTNRSMSYAEIEQLLSLNRSTVENMTQAFRDTLSYQKKYPEDDRWAAKYSYFYEVNKRADLRDWVRRRGNRERLMEWIYLERIKTGADIRRLPLILRNKSATRVLNKSGIERAYSFIVDKDPSLADEFYARVANLTTQMKAVGAKELLLAASDPNRSRLIKSLSENAARLSDNVQKIRRLQSGKRHRTPK